MIHAYDKIYLEKGRVNLGRMLDFVVYDLNYTLGDFYQMFLQSPVAKRFGEGDYRYLVGMSGVELAYSVLEECGIVQERIKPRYTMNRSPEYWAGWAMAYYQWDTGLAFDKINTLIPIEEVREMYIPYHEMDIRQFCDHLNQLYDERSTDTNLKTYRQNAGLSQRELADRSGIPLRTIQQYEQRQKKINSARIETVLAMAKILCCQPEDLLERK